MGGSPVESLGEFGSVKLPVTTEMLQRDEIAARLHRGPNLSPEPAFPNLGEVILQALFKSFGLIFGLIDSGSLHDQDSTS